MLNSNIFPDRQTKYTYLKGCLGCVLVSLCGIALIAGLFLYWRHSDDVEFVGTSCSAQMLSDLHNYPYKIVFDRNKDLQTNTLIMGADGNHSQPYQGNSHKSPITT